MRRLAQYAETCDLNRVEMGDTKLGIITSSTSYQYVKEVFGEEASVLKLGMVHPMPEGLIRDFAAKVDRLVVVEELDPIIENYCRQLGLTVSGKEALPLEGEFSQNLVAAKLGGAVHTLSVSYTHLDVYKRQGWNEAPGGPGADRRKPCSPR